MNLFRSYTATNIENSRQITDELIIWLRSYFSRRINSRWIDERRCIPPYIVMDFARKGLLGFHIEEAYGGLGLTCKDAVRLISQMGALDATISQLVLINALAIRPVMSHGSDYLKSTYLSAQARGEFLCAFAQTEEEAGTDFMKIKTQAVYDKTKEKWIISGDKYWIGNAGWSGMITLVCRTLDENNKDVGLSCFLVPTDTPGVHIGDELNTMGLRGVVQNRLHFNNVEVSDVMMLGNKGRGMEVAIDAMSFARITIAAQQIGLMKKSVLIVYRFMTNREIATGKLIDNLVAINMLSECIARILVLECFLNRITTVLDQGQSVPFSISALCKVLASEFAGFVTDKTLQFLGGRGYDENNMIPQFVRDTRVTRIFEGPSEALLSFVGSRFKSDGGQAELSTLFDARSIKSTLPNVLQKIKDVKQEVSRYDFNDKQKIEWLNYKVGLISAWTILKLSSTDMFEAKSAVDGWLNNGDDDMPRFVGGDCFLSPEVIQATILSFSESVGEIKQNIPGLCQKTDSLIKGV